MIRDGRSCWGTVAGKSCRCTWLTAAYSAALYPLRPLGTGRDPGRIATDLAVMFADGGETLADPAVLRAQTEVFGFVASSLRHRLAAARRR
jgi:hypothetical protein